MTKPDITWVARSWPEIFPPQTALHTVLCIPFFLSSLPLIMELQERKRLGLETSALKEDQLPRHNLDSAVSDLCFCFSCLRRSGEGWFVFNRSTVTNMSRTWAICRREHVQILFHSRKCEKQIPVTYWSVLWCFSSNVNLSWFWRKHSWQFSEFDRIVKSL